MTKPPSGEAQFFTPTGFGTTIAAYQQAGMRMASKASIIGMQLMRVLLVIAVAWFGIKVMMGAEGGAFESALGSFVTSTFLWGLIVWLFKDYIPIVTDIIHGFVFIGAFLTSGATNVSQTTQTMGYLLPGIHLLHIGASTVQAITSLPWGKGGTSITAHLWNIGISISVIPFLFMLSAFEILAAALYIIMALLSVVMIAIALGIGPIFIPFLLLDISRFLFDGWFRFLLTAAAWRLVGAIMLGLMQKLQAVAALAGNAGGVVYQTKSGYYGVSFIGGIGDILVTAVMVFMVLEIPVIAGGLASGTPSIRMPGGFDLVKSIGRIR